MNTAKLEHRSNQTTCRVQVVALLISAAMTCGCAGPWAQTKLPLRPASKAIPTPLKEAYEVARIRDAHAVPAPENLPSQVAPPQENPQFNLPGNLLERSSAAVPESKSVTDEQLIIRGQNVDESAAMEGYSRSPMSVSGDSGRPDGYRVAQAPGYGQPSYGGSDYGAPSSLPGNSAPNYSAPSYGAPSSYPGSSFTDGQAPGGYNSPNYAPYDGSGIDPMTTTGGQYGGGDGVMAPLPGDYADLVVNLRETQTGRFMFGVGVNSDLGLTAQAVLDERNFDWRRWPRSIGDITNGTAWRGGGQMLRIEAVPGTEVQRYMVNFTQPYLWDTPISFNLSGYLFDRRYFDWTERRVGGRVGLGYRITPDLSISFGLRGEQIDFKNPRVRGIKQIEDVLGESDLFSGKITLTHDTRDIPFAPTQGHYLEMSYEQVFGSFDYPRGVVDYRRYFLLRQRADRSGRHTLGFSFRGGISGSQTPVYENFFAGGYSTMRGFRFRHASPKIQDVIIGGQLSLLNSIEYIFPITADDMLKGAIFCDHGTIEESYDDIDFNDYRIAIGAGLRINVPAMGPAPIAVDFAIPLNREGSDRIQNFSFFVGVGR